MIKIASKWSLAFSILIFFFLQASLAQNEKLSKSYQKEIEVADFPQIISQGFWDMEFESHGRMSSKRKNRDYIMVPGGNDDVPALRLKEYFINTWDKASVKLEVEIVVIPDKDDPDQAQELLDELQIELKLNEKNEILIDENLNMAKFGFENGFFSRNVNTYTLENGKSFRVKGLSIQAALFIPKKSHLYLRYQLGYITIGDLEGKLQADLLSSRLTGGRAKEFEGRFQFYANVQFTQIEKASIQSENSEFKVEELGSLSLGNPTQMEARIPLLEAQRLQRSTHSKYYLKKVGEIKVYESINDKFFIGQLGSLTSLHSTFTDYEIKELHSSLKLRAKNGDLKIEGIKSGFSSIEIDNKISEIHLNFSSLENLEIRPFQHSYTEYDIPEKMKKILMEMKTTYRKGTSSKAGKISLLCNGCVLRITE
ncbi:MAG: hypothetical protein AAFR87_20970 [Bacteroidota bacterium]